MDNSYVLNDSKNGWPVTNSFSFGNNGTMATDDYTPYVRQHEVLIYTHHIILPVTASIPCNAHKTRCSNIDTHL